MSTSVTLMVNSTSTAFKVRSDFKIAIPIVRHALLNETSRMLFNMQLKTPAILTCPFAVDCGSYKLTFDCQNRGVVTCKSRNQPSRNQPKTRERSEQINPILLPVIGIQLETHRHWNWEHISPFGQSCLDSIKQQTVHVLHRLNIYFNF
jgi:hypothetical protein